MRRETERREEARMHKERKNKEEEGKRQKLTQVHQRCQVRVIPEGWVTLGFSYFFFFYTQIDKQVIEQ